MSESDSDGGGPTPPAPPLTDTTLPALFWDTIPGEPGENGEEHPDMAAIRAVLDESSPQELAENAKRQGNEHLKLGQQSCNTYYVREAITLYTRGLKTENLGDEDNALRSVLFGNRAQAELLLRNWGNALRDARDAVRLDASNVKAYYRGAKAALQLCKYEECAALCKAGLVADPSARELDKMRADAAAAAQRQHDEDRRRAETAAAARAPARRLAQELLARGWRVGRPQFSVGARKPELDEGDRSVHWPVLFMYPQAGMESDCVEDVHEQHALSAHLDVMFGPSAPPLAWDREGAYTRDAIELYYLSNAATPLDEEQLVEVIYGGWPADFEDMGPQAYGSNAAAWVRVAEDCTLAQLLGRRDYVVPGVPVLFVLARGTEYRERFLHAGVPVVGA